MRQILGIDVGGTKIAAGLVDKSFKVSKLAILPTSQADLLGQLGRLIADYDKFEAIGIGMPGQVWPDGTVARLPNVKGFKSLNLKKLLQKRFKVPVEVVNDAKAFALAEALAGSGKRFDSVAGMILGTGIGVGLVINKKIYPGKDGVAGEFDHITLLDGKAIGDHRRKAGMFDHAIETKQYLKMLLGMIILSFNPDIVFLGGAWSRLPGMEKLANELSTNVGGYVNKTPVKVSKLKFAGIIGAALPLLRR